MTLGLNETEDEFNARIKMKLVDLINCICSCIRNNSSYYAFKRIIHEKLKSSYYVEQQHVQYPPDSEQIPRYSL